MVERDKRTYEHDPEPARRDSERVDKGSLDDDKPDVQAAGPAVTNPRGVGAPSATGAGTGQLKEKEPTERFGGAMTGPRGVGAPQISGSSVERREVGYEDGQPVIRPTGEPYESDVRQVPSDVHERGADLEERMPGRSAAEGDVEPLERDANPGEEQEGETRVEVGGRTPGPRVKPAERVPAAYSGRDVTPPHGDDTLPRPPARDVRGEEDEALGSAARVRHEPGAGTPPLDVHDVGMDDDERSRLEEERMPLEIGKKEEDTESRPLPDVRELPNRDWPDRR
jgi:hypothetical protein